MRYRGCVVAHAHVDLGQAARGRVHNVGTPCRTAVLDRPFQQRNRALECGVAVHGFAGVDLAPRSGVLVCVRLAEHNLAERLAEPAVGQSAKEVGPRSLGVAVVLVALDALHPQEPSFGHPAGALHGAPEPVRVLRVEQTPAVAARREVASGAHDLV